MPLASNVSTVVVTGTYVDFQGNAIAGQVIFRVPKMLRNALADQILVPSAYYATLDANGQFSATLPSTNDPDFHETFTYTVTESFASGRTFSMVLPVPLTYTEFGQQTYAYWITLGESYGEATQVSADMADLAPAAAVTPHVSLASQAIYASLAIRVTAAEATVDTTPPTTGIIMTSVYNSVPVGYATYTLLASSGPATYTALITAQILATSAAIQNYATAAQASQATAQAGRAAAEAAEVRDPHPFVFTGAA